MKKTSRLFLILLIIGSLSGIGVAADEEMLRPGHPTRYVVQKGDTLWDIAGRFLNKPWRWPEIWQVNPEIRNPHLIYPGDELSLVYVDGRPRLMVNRGPVKLSPSVRSTPVRQAVPTIPIDHIAPYLSRPYVLDKKNFHDLPYVVGFANEHLAAGAGQQLYVKNLGDATEEQYDIVRPGEPYRDGRTNEILGYEAICVGSGKVTRRQGEIAGLSVFRTRREILGGDRLLPFSSAEMATDFQPHAPKQEIQGTIIAALDRVNEIGRYDVVVIDRGSRDGLDPGTVLQIDNSGEVVIDPVLREEGIEFEDRFLNMPRRRFPAEVKLPDEEAGLLMIFRTFDRVSFGLVMYASKAIHIHDRVVNPL